MAKRILDFDSQLQIIKEILEEGTEIAPSGDDPYGGFLRGLGHLGQIVGTDRVYFWTGGELLKMVYVTLAASNNRTLVRNVVHLFVSAQDAKRHPLYDPKSYQVESLGTLLAFFQLITMNEVDTILVYPQKGRLQKSFSLSRPKITQMLIGKLNQATLSLELPRKSKRGWA